MEEGALSKGFDILWRCLPKPRMLPEPSVRDGGSHPVVHVGGGRDDLGAGHLLHALQGFLSLGSIEIGCGALAWYLQISIFTMLRINFKILAVFSRAIIQSTVLF